MAERQLVSSRRPGSCRPATMGVSLAALCLLALGAACGGGIQMPPVSTSPATTSPATTSPATTSPATTSPATTSPATTSPVTTSPVTTSPVVTSPAESLEAVTTSTYAPSLEENPNVDEVGLSRLLPLSYGDDPLQVGDLRIPPGKDTHPVVVLIHGGFWRSGFDKSLMTLLAEDATERGAATWNVEYRSVGDPGGGCLLYTSPSPRDLSTSRMPSSA